MTHVIAGKLTDRMTPVFKTCQSKQSIGFPSVTHGNSHNLVNYVSTTLPYFFLNFPHSESLPPGRRKA